MTSTALSLTVLAAATALGGGVAVADDGDAALDNTTLLGPVVTPIVAPGLATNAAQNVPVTLCAVSSPILGVLGGPGQPQPRAAIARAPLPRPQVSSDSPGPSEDDWPAHLSPARDLFIATGEAELHAVIDQALLLTALER